MKKESRAKTQSELTARDEQIMQLEGQAQILKIFCLAVIRVVGELGGMAKLVKFFESYREIRKELESIGVVPSSHPSKATK